MLAGLAARSYTANAVRSAVVGAGASRLEAKLAGDLTKRAVKTILSRQANDNVPLAAANDSEQVMEANSFVSRFGIAGQGAVQKVEKPVEIVSPVQQEIHANRAPVGNSTESISSISKQLSSIINLLSSIDSRLREQHELYKSSLNKEDFSQREAILENQADAAQIGALVDAKPDRKDKASTNPMLLIAFAAIATAISKVKDNAEELGTAIRVATEYLASIPERMANFMKGRGFTENTPSPSTKPDSATPAAPAPPPSARPAARDNDLAVPYAGVLGPTGAQAPAAARESAPRASGSQGNSRFEIIASGIQRVESGQRGYNDYNLGSSPKDERNFKGRPQINLSNITIAEYLRRSKLPAGNKDRLFAIGRYQITPSTMEAAVKALNLPLTTKLTPQTQDYIFEEYLIDEKQDSAIKDYITGRKSGPQARKEAILAGSREWAGIAIPIGSRDSRGRIATSARHSYYKGVGGNNAGMTAEEFGALLDKQREATMSTRTPPSMAPRIEPSSKAPSSQQTTVISAPTNVIAPGMGGGKPRRGPVPSPTSPVNAFVNYLLGNTF